MRRELLAEIRAALWAEHVTGLPMRDEYRKPLIRELDDTMRAMAPMTSKEKQEAFRARQAMLGHTEVRGIFLPPAMHAALKAYARKLASAVSANAPAQSGVEAESMRKKSGSKPRQS